MSKNNLKKKNKKINLIPATDFFITLNKKHLLLDTSAFIDALVHPVEFQKFFNKCKKQEITLVTIESVVIEFTKGTANSADLAIAATGIKHYRDLCIFTKNPKDFPEPMFSLKSNLIIKMAKDLQIYGVFEKML